MLDTIERSGEAPAVSNDCPEPVKVKGIAICGSHPATVALAPFDDDWLIYACSPDNSPYGLSDNAKALPRADVWFELHDPVFDRTRPYQYLDWLKTVPKVYMRDKIAMENMKTADGHPLFPNAELYPEDEMHKVFGPFYFTSSICYIMAVAIADCIENNIPAIGLFGIMQASKNEYAYQRPGLQAMIWEAARRGIKVYAPDVSQLFEPPAHVW